MLAIRFAYDRFLTGAALIRDGVLKISFFTRDDCELCDTAWFVVNRVARRFDVLVERVDIDAVGNEHWRDAYTNDIPVVHLDGREVFRHRVDEGALRLLLGG